MDLNRRVLETCGLTAPLRISRRLAARRLPLGSASAPLRHRAVGLPPSVLLRLPLKGGVMSISWERGRPARILSLPALPPPPVPPVKLAEVAVPEPACPRMPQAVPQVECFCRVALPRGSVRGCSWRGLGGAVRCGRGAPESPPTRLRATRGSHNHGLTPGTCSA